MGLKTDGHRCNRPDNGTIHLEATHLHYCRTHWDVYDRHVEARRHLTEVVEEQHHRAGTCHHWMPTGRRWCGNLCENGMLLCRRHHENTEHRIQREEALQEAIRIETEAVRAGVQQYRQQQLTWRQVIDDLFQPENNFTPRIRYRIARQVFLNPVVPDPDFVYDWQFRLYWNWNLEGRLGPAPNIVVPPLQLPHYPPPARGLAALARDAQNVHTAVVVDQTNKGLEKLLNASKDGRVMRGPEWFAARWLLRSYGGWNAVQRIVTDMQHWYGRSYCKEANDFLYRRVLDGLYITIQKVEDNEMRMELYKRAFEECLESVGMCCEGHISRLCNVLVGFDDAFAPPVPFGEILQSKMAAIAGLDVDTEEKIRQATAFFNENSVPEAERSAWLEAF